MSTTKTPKEIAASPLEHGFKWYTAPIAKNKMELRKDAPRVEVVDLDKFVESFGSAVVLAAMNGTSLDVSVESVVREAIFKNRAVTNDTLREAIVSRVLLKDRSRTSGVREVVVEKPTWKSYDGNVYGTEVEKLQADLAHFIDNGMSMDAARKMLKLDE